MKILKSSVKFISISEDESNQRIDNFLIKKMKNIPKKAIYRMLRKGEIRINKKRKKPKYKIKNLDIVRIPPIEYFNNENTNNFKNLSFNIDSCRLYEDKYILILNKPSGIAVHKGSGIKIGIIEILRKIYLKYNFLELVHRLDRGTSGILVIAKKRSVLCDLHNQLRNNKIYKDYIILVHGKCTFKKILVSAPLLKRSFLNKSLKYKKQKVIIDKNGKISQTYFKVIEKFNSFTLLKAIPKTGRMHQIRVHSKYINHPIVCDNLYNDIKNKKNLFFKKNINRIFLHASNICFKHPISSKTININAPLEESLYKYLQLIRKCV